MESSSYYDEAGRKVYHNVRYGERYDPSRHTLFIPEMYEFPEMFNLKLQKELYLADYADFLRRHNPEIGDPDMLRKYYDTAKSAKRIMDAVPNSDMNRIFRKGGSVSVRGWLPDGECVVFPSVKSASEATGCAPDAIRQCVRGERTHAYGIRWELVDISDMDTLVNRYIGRIMDVCEKGEVDIDWDSYLSEEARKRLVEKSSARGGFSPSKDDIRRMLGMESGISGMDTYEPDSETEHDFRFVDPFAEDLYGADYGELPASLAVEADMDDMEERLRREISELEDERDDLAARRESPLNALLDDMLGDE